jgi:hypothetical protein
MEAFEGLEDEELVLLLREPQAGASPLDAFGALWERRKAWIRQQERK